MSIPIVSPKQSLLAILFPLFTFVALGIDSLKFSTTYFDGRQLTNILSFCYFLMMYYCSGDELRKLMIVMVFLSYLGEIIFCQLLGMYTYRTPGIPLYVPFGHAIVYASGYILAHTGFSWRNEAKLRVVFAAGFAVLFLFAGFFFNDKFTVIFGCLFFLLLWRKRWENMYYFIAICVIIIELIGTYFKCWGWTQRVFGYISTANPPMGAVFFYAGGDVLLAKIASLWNKRSSKASAAKSLV
ncbi:MAG TPA: hypothetical protein VF679_03055 [Pedobacter sp.]